MSTINLTVSTVMSEDELAEIIADNIPPEDVAQFLKLIESKYEDWGVAEDIAKFYVKSIVDLLVDYQDDLEWNDEFKGFLLEQANRL